MERTKRTRMTSLILSLLLMVGMIIPNISHAATRIKVETKPGQAETWDLLTNEVDRNKMLLPIHYVINDDGSEGDLCYCLQHKKPSPHADDTYVPYDPNTKLSQKAIDGLQIILELGYPEQLPFGTVNAAEAHYATGNAIRFWLSEVTGGPNEDSYGYTNLSNVNLEAAYETCVVEGRIDASASESTRRTFRAAIRLLQEARSQKLPEHTITLSTQKEKMTVEGNYYVSTAHIELKGMDNFKIDMASLPSGSMVTDLNGNTITSGTKSMDVKLKIPRSGNADKSLNLVVSGTITGPAAQMYWITCNGSAQDLYWSQKTMKQTEKILTFKTPSYGYMTIEKQDSETGTEAQGDATLKGATFEIVADEDIPEDNIKKGDVVQSLYLDGVTKATSKKLPAGRYLVREKISPTGYSVNVEAFGITVKADDTVSVVVPDKVIEAPISIIKFVDRPLTGNPENDKIKEPEQGATFDVILKSSGKVCDTLICDENGYAKSKPLPYGVYTVKQTAGKEGYQFVEPFDVEIKENSSEPIPYLIENTVLHNQVKIVKVDSESGKVITQAGVKFRIQDSDGNWVSQKMLYPTPVTIDVFETAEDGTLVLPEPLRYGKYKLFEVEAPYKYLLNEDYLEFEIKDSSTVQLEVEFPNQPVKGTIEIEKTGKMLTGVKEETLETGEIVKHPVFETQKLAGVSIDIIAAEDIITPDNVVHYKKGDLVQNIVTTKDKNVSQELYLGKYIVRERESVDGFLLDTKEYPVTLEYKDQHTPLVMETVSLVNERATVEILLEKEKEIFTEEGDYQFEPGSGAKFALIADEDIYSEAGAPIEKAAEPLIQKGEIVAVFQTAEDGKGIFEGCVPYAKYVVKELQPVSPDHELCEKEFPVDLTFRQDTPVIKVAVNDGEPIQNTLKKVPIQISKTDITGEKAVPGAKIEILNEQGVTIFEGVSGEDGKTEEIFLPVNSKYTFKETYSAEGFALNTSVFPFEITADGEIIGETTIKDEVSKIWFIKKDGKTGQPLQGVKLGLFDEDGNLIQEQVSDSQGYVVFERVPFGKFQVKELETVDGYQLSGETFEIEVDGTYENPKEPTEILNYPIVQTGFESFPWWSIAAFAGAGSVAILIVWLYRKRKK